MTKKLKCWRKIKNTSEIFRYRHKHNDFVVGAKTHGKQEWNLPSIINKTFRTKKSAEKFAKSYMRKHDKC